MLTKRSIITGLVGLNLLLCAILLAGSLKSPSVFAQAGGAPGNYITVTAKASGQSYDVLYLLNTSTRKLHAFYPNPRGNRYLHAHPRDLLKDFDRN